MKNRLNITISGLQLTVNTDYDQAAADALADVITKRMDEILKNSRYNSKLDASLLLLLETVDRNRQLEAACSALKKKLETMALDLEIQRVENEKLSAKEAESKK